MFDGLPTRAVAALFGVRSIGEVGVSQAGSDGEDGPMLDVGHPGRFAEALDDGVIVDHNEGLVADDGRDERLEALRKVEA